MADKLEVMNSVLNKMEDIKNTQKSLIEKLGHVEVELFEIDSKELDEKLSKVHNSAAESMDIISEAIESFEIKKNKLQEGL